MIDGWMDDGMQGVTQRGTKMKAREKLGGRRERLCDELVIRDLGSRS